MIQRQTKEWKSKRKKFLAELNTENVKSSRQTTDDRPISPHTLFQLPI